MISPRFHRENSGFFRYGGLNTISFNGETAFNHLHVLSLVRVEVQGRLLIGQSEKAGMMAVEFDLEGKCFPGMFKEGGSYGSFKAAVC